jgi:predicted kinase
MAPIVEILVGHIASGKSSFAKMRAKEGAVIISDDAIVNGLHADIYSMYDKSLKPLYKSVENQALSMALSLGRDAIVDRPNYSKAMRQRYAAIARSLDCRVEIVVFPKASLEAHAMRRSKSDGRGYSYQDWLDVVKRHESLYEEPTEDEADTIRILTKDYIEAIIPYSPV